MRVELKTTFSGVSKAFVDGCLLDLPTITNEQIADFYNGKEVQVEQITPEGTALATFKLLEASNET